jgi:threonine synthase
VAYRKLRATGFFKPNDTVVLFNTGSGLKYLDVLEASTDDGAAGASPASSSSKTPTTCPIGGIIGPY